MEHEIPLFSPWEVPLGPHKPIAGVVGTHPCLGLNNKLKQK